MVTEVNDMQELTTLSEDLIKNMNELEDSLKAMKSIVGKANNYDGIDVTTAANILKRNLSAIAKDAKNTARNIKNYMRGLNTLDIDDFTTQANIFSLNNAYNHVSDFFTETLPDGINNVITGVGNATKGLANTIFSPITMIVNSINIIDKKEEPEEEVTNETITEMPLYDQTDYATTKYGTGTIASSGCGITCLAMVASYYTGEEWTPDECANLVNESGIRPKDNVHRMLIAADKVGLNYEQKTTSDIMPALKEGKTVIALVNNSGHFVVLKGLTEDGRVLVNDPYGPWQYAENQTGRNLKINENGYIEQNEINLSAGRIWVFDGTTSKKSENHPVTV